MSNYATKDEAIEREIVAVLGDAAADFNIEAIADEVLEYVTTGDLSRDGFALVEGVDFWEVAARHDRTA